MAQIIINVGTNPNDGTGDKLRNGMIKVNSNFTDLYTTSYATNVVNSFNTRLGAITLLANDVTGALTYTPLNKAGDTATGLVTFTLGLNSFNPIGINANAQQIGLLPLPPSNTLLRLANADTKNSIITLDSFVNTGNPTSALLLRGARGTGSGPLAIQITDIIGQVTATGHTGVSFGSNSSALINFVSEGNFSSSSTPTAIAFQVTPSSSITPSEVVRITSAGILSVLSTTASSSTSTGALTVAGGAGVAGALYAGSLQNTPIGSTTPNTGAFTTVSTAGNITPSIDVTYDLGTSALHYRNQYLNGVFVNNSTVVSVPTTGNTVTIATQTSSQIIDPAGSLAALTIQFPTPLADGHLVDIVITQAITTLTTTPNAGATVVGSPASTSTYTTMRFKYYAATTKWYRIV